MTKRHLVIGVVLWLGLAYLGARWVARPLLWSIAGMGTLCCEHKTLETAQSVFIVHLAPFNTPQTNANLNALTDDESELVDPALRDWALRETRNRFFLGFALWMASGWLIHWLLGRIIRGRGAYG